MLRKHQLKKIAYKKYNSELGQFWKLFKKLDREQKVNLLRSYSNLLIWRISKKELTRKRQQFLKNQIRRKLLSKDCSVCSVWPVIRHHIIPLKNGGKNNSANLIPMCEGCHARIHDWIASPQFKKLQDNMDQEYLKVVNAHD